VSESPRPDGPHNPELLAIYCNDHLAASTGGIELVQRMIGEHRGASYGPLLERLCQEFQQEQAALESAMQTLGIAVRPYKRLAVWIGEKVARLKPNGRLLSRSPLSELEEFEFLATAVRAKRQGFETLRVVAETDTRLDREKLDRLIQQAERQYEELIGTRREIAASVFGGRPDVV